MSALSAQRERPMLEEIGPLAPSTATRDADSLNLSHLASADLEELAHIFARAFLRFDQAQEKQNDAQNEVDPFANDEQLSSSCEPNLFASRSTAPTSARRTPRLERAR